MAIIVDVTRETTAEEDAFPWRISFTVHENEIVGMESNSIFFYFFYFDRVGHDRSVSPGGVRAREIAKIFAPEALAPAAT